MVTDAHLDTIIQQIRVDIVSDEIRKLNTEKTSFLKRLDKKFNEEIAFRSEYRSTQGHKQSITKKAWDTYWKICLERDALLEKTEEIQNVIDAKMVQMKEISKGKKLLADRVNFGTLRDEDEEQPMKPDYSQHFPQNVLPHALPPIVIETDPLTGHLSKSDPSYGKPTQVTIVKPTEESIREKYKNMHITNLTGSQKTTKEPEWVAMQDIVPQECDSRSLTSTQREALAEGLCTQLESVPEASNFINVTTMQCKEPGQKVDVGLGDMDTDVLSDDDEELEGAIRTDAYPVTIGGQKVFFVKKIPTVCTTNITEISHKECVGQIFCTETDEDDFGEEAEEEYQGESAEVFKLELTQREILKWKSKEYATQKAIFQSPLENMSRLPEGITNDSIDLALQYKDTIIQAVNAIVMDETRSMHSNGTAKLWGVGIMNIAIIGTMANLQVGNDNLLARLKKWRCEDGGGGGPGGSAASYFSNIATIKDTEDEEPILQFPPEPYFMHPLAEAAAKQMENPKKLFFVPPSHAHTHDYYATYDNIMCPIVREAKSGSSFRLELDKCLLGICKCLQAMEHAIGITSSFAKCALHLGSVATEYAFDSDKYHTVLVESVTIEKKMTQYGM